MSVVDYQAVPKLAKGAGLSRHPGAHLLVLGQLILLEIVVFALIGNHFFGWTNFFEVVRLTAEMGLIALALTPVIVTGGIDLSVGSMLGLSAVLFGKLWRDWHLPIPIAAVVAMLAGAMGGWFNAAMITRLRTHPLMVTLGTYVLFRGLAEGIAKGSDNFTNFPSGFLFLGNGKFGPIPAQLPILVLVAIAFYLLLHRSVLGRAWSAIGYSPEGARYAGIPVDRRITLAYVLCGFCSALAAIISVAKVGQATADAGTGYELSAITAVVLGGTSIFGGRGSIIGTLLGLFAIAILKNGLRLADLPPELADVLSGLMLLVAIGLDRRSSKPRSQPARATSANVSDEEELNMRNSQLAVLCSVILIAALIIVGGNYSLMKGLSRDLLDQRQTDTTAGRPAQPAGKKPVVIGMMPKAKGDTYFIACHKGAEEAAKELGVTLLWDGPTDPDPAKQNEIVDTWITRGVDVIAVSVQNGDGLSTALRKARAHGIKVITWDADANPDARDFFINQGTFQDIGFTLMDNAARILGNKGSFAIITASLTDANQNQWMKFIEQRRLEKYPDIKRVTVLPSDGQQTKAAEQTKAILNSSPEVKLIMAIAAPAVPGAAEAVKQSGRTDVKVMGLSLPNLNKTYIHSGVTDCIVLWNTMDLGYLTVYASDAVATGKLKQGDTSMDGGRLGKIKVDGDTIMLGQPFVFNKDNIDGFDF